MSRILHARISKRFWRYVARESEGAADRLVDRIYATCQLHATQLNSGTDVAHLAAGLRCFSVGNYVVFFQPREDGLMVVRVLHGARDIESLFRS